MVLALTRLHFEERKDANGAVETLRVVLLHDNGAQISVGVMAHDAIDAREECSFWLDEAFYISKKIIAGDMRAATRPGMARILAAAIIVLSKAGAQSGALIERPLDQLMSEGQLNGRSDE